METNGAVETYTPGRLSAAEIRADVNLIQEVMQAVMKVDVHYGKVPGCGDKPTLLKPGAEKIASTFRLAIDPAVEDLSKDDEIRYRVAAKVTHQQTRVFLGAGIGEASTNEEKYKWRKVVSSAEWDATPEDRKRVKYARDHTTQQIRTNPADVANTVLKMAKKRALIDAVLTITAASDIFTQDIEDLPEELAGSVAGGKPDTIATPQAKAPAPAAAAAPAASNESNGNPPRVSIPEKALMRAMVGRFDGKCGLCNDNTKGAEIYYDATTKKAYHKHCVDFVQ